MRTAETIVTVIRERGTRGLPLERVYRLLFNRELYLRAYARLYPNKGAMTAGSTPETVDGMSLAKIDKLIDAVRHERHRWTPVRRMFIPKSNGKQRPLGIPTWSDKLLQEVIRSILEAYFEPQFSRCSHGFRPERGCHTALQHVQQAWTGTKWFIEGDIAQYFDTINHDVLMGILSSVIRDGRFLRLIRELLVVGYMDGWKFNATLSGAPQGGVLSPLLANIYLHQFDQWVERELIPAHTKGTVRQGNAVYRTITSRIERARRKGDKTKLKALLKQRRTLPSQDPNDTCYRRLRYIRYADDFLLGFAGPKAEAEAIKEQIKAWLSDNLKLKLSDEKTLITHAQDKARFLGYEITCIYSEDKLSANKRRGLHGQVALRVPLDVLRAKCVRYRQNGVIKPRLDMLRDDDFTIVAKFQQEYRGIVQYYLYAHNVAWFNSLHYVMRSSLLKTFASKHRVSVATVAKRLATTTETPEGKTLKCLAVRVERKGKRPLIAQFGGISLTRKPTAILNDCPQPIWDGHTELIQRLLADECELCGSRENIEVHHIRKLADLDRPGRKERPAWVKRMAARQRKTLVMCRACHRAIHAGRQPK